MQDFFKYDKIQGGSPLFMKSDHDGSKDQNKLGLPLGIKTTAQGIKHFTSWDDISNSIEERNTARFDDAQPNALRFSMNNARAVYEVVDDINIYPVAKSLEPQYGLLHRQNSKLVFEDRWEANDITILDDIAFVSYQDYSDVHRYDIDMKAAGVRLEQASTFNDDTEAQKIVSTMRFSANLGSIDKIFPLGVQDPEQSSRERLALDFASLDNTILKIQFTQTSSGGFSFNQGQHTQSDWSGGSGDTEQAPQVIYLTYGGVLPNFGQSEQQPIGQPILSATERYSAPSTVTSVSGGGSLLTDINGNVVDHTKADKVVGKFYLVVDSPERRLPDSGDLVNIPRTNVVGVQLDIACNWGMRTDNTTTNYSAHKALHTFEGVGFGLPGLKTYEIDTDAITLIKVQPIRKCGKVDIYTRKRGIVDAVVGNSLTSLGHNLNTNDVIEITAALFDTSSPSYADIHPMNGKKFVKKIDTDTFQIFDDQFFQNPTTTSSLRSTSGINWTCISNSHGSIGQSWDYYGTMFSPTGRNGYRNKSNNIEDQTGAVAEYITTKRIPSLLNEETSSQNQQRVFSQNVGYINLLFDEATEDFAKELDDNLPTRFTDSSPFNDPKRGPQDFYPYFCSSTPDQMIDGLDATVIKSQEASDTLYTPTPYTGTRFGSALDFKFSHMSGDSKVYVLAIGERGSDLSVDLFGVEESECHIDSYSTQNPDENDGFYKYGRVKNCNSIKTPAGTQLVQNFRRRMIPWHLPYGKTHVLQVTVDRYGRISGILHQNTLFGGGTSIHNDDTWVRTYDTPEGDTNLTLSDFAEENPWKKFEKQFRAKYPAWVPSQTLTQVDTSSVSATIDDLTIISGNSAATNAGTTLGSLYNTDDILDPPDSSVVALTDNKDNTIIAFSKNRLTGAKSSHSLQDFSGLEDMPPIESVVITARGFISAGAGTITPVVSFQLFKQGWSVNSPTEPLTSEFDGLVFDKDATSFPPITRTSQNIITAAGLTATPSDWDNSVMVVTGGSNPGPTPSACRLMELSVTLSVEVSVLEAVDPIHERADVLFYEPEYYTDLNSKYSTKYWLRAAAMHWYPQDIHSHYFNALASTQAAIKPASTIPFYRKFNHTTYNPRLPAFPVDGFEIDNTTQTESVTTRAVLLTNSKSQNTAFSRFGYTGVGESANLPTFFEINRFRNTYTQNPSGEEYGPPVVGNGISHMSQWYIYPWVDSFGKSVAINRVGDEFVVLSGCRSKSNPEIDAGYLDVEGLDPLGTNPPLHPSNNTSRRYAGLTNHVNITETKIGQINAAFLSVGTYDLQDFNEINSTGSASKRYFRGVSFFISSEQNDQLRDVQSVPVKYRKLSAGSDAGFGIAEVVASAELSNSKIMWTDDYIVWSEQKLFSGRSTIYFFKYSYDQAFYPEDAINKDFIDIRGGRTKNIWDRRVSPALNVGDGFGIDFRFDNTVLVTNALGTSTEFGDTIASEAGPQALGSSAEIYAENVRMDALEIYERRLQGNSEKFRFDFIQKIRPSIDGDEAKYPKTLIKLLQSRPFPLPNESATTASVPYLVRLNNINYENRVQGSYTWNINLAGRYDVIDKKIIIKDPLEYSLYACNFRTDYDVGNIDVSTRTDMYLKPYLSWVEEATCGLKSENSFVKYNYDAVKTYTSSDECGGHWAANRNKSITKTPVFFLEVPLESLDTMDDLTITFEVENQVGIFQKWRNGEDVPDNSRTNNAVAVPKVVLYKKDPRSTIILNGPSDTTTNELMPPFSQDGIWSEIVRSDPAATNSELSRYAPQHPGFFRGGAADLFFYGSLPGSSPLVGRRNWEDYNESTKIYTYSNYYGGEKNLGEYFDLTYGSHGSAGIPSWIANDVLDAPFLTPVGRNGTLAKYIGSTSYAVNYSLLGQFGDSYASLYNPTLEVNVLGEATRYTLTIPANQVRRHLIKGSLIKSSSDDRAVFGNRPTGTLYPEIYNTNLSSPGFDDVNKPTYNTESGEVLNTLAIGFVMTNVTAHNIGLNSSFVEPEPFGQSPFGALRTINRNVPINSKTTGGLTKYPYSPVNNLYSRGETNNPVKAFSQTAACDFTMSADIFNITFRGFKRSTTPKRFHNKFHKVAVFKYDEAAVLDAQQNYHVGFNVSQLITNLFGKSKFTPITLGLSQVRNDPTNYPKNGNDRFAYPYNSMLQSIKPIVRFGQFSKTASVSGLMPSAADVPIKHKGTYVKGIQVLNTENISFDDTSYYVDTSTGHAVDRVPPTGEVLGSAFFNKSTFIGSFDITSQFLGENAHNPDYVSLYIKSPNVISPNIPLYNRGIFSVNSIVDVGASGDGGSGVFTVFISGVTRSRKVAPLFIGKKLVNEAAPLYIDTPLANEVTLFTKTTQPSSVMPLVTPGPSLSGGIDLTFAPPITGITPLYTTGPVASSSFVNLHIQNQSKDAVTSELFTAGRGIVTATGILFTSGIAHANNQIPLVFAPETSGTIPLYVKSAIPVSGDMPSGVSLKVRGRGPASGVATLLVHRKVVDANVPLLIDSERPNLASMDLNVEGFIDRFNTDENGSNPHLISKRDQLFDLGGTNSAGAEQTITKEIAAKTYNSNSLVSKNFNIYSHNANTNLDANHLFAQPGRGISYRTLDTDYTGKRLNTILPSDDPSVAAREVYKTNTNSNYTFFLDANNTDTWAQNYIVKQEIFDANGNYLVAANIPRMTTSNNPVQLIISTINGDGTISQNGEYGLKNVLYFNLALPANAGDVLRKEGGYEFRDPFYTLRSDLYDRAMQQTSTAFKKANLQSVKTKLLDLKLSKRDRCALSLRVESVYRLGTITEQFIFDVIIIFKIEDYLTTTDGYKTAEPLAINGYYPLYRTAVKARLASPNPSEIRYGETTEGYHEHTINGTTYYMPNGLEMGITQFHGDYIDNSPVLDAESYNWTIFDHVKTNNIYTNSSAGLSIAFSNEDLYFDKREKFEEIWKLSLSDDYKTATQAISFDDLTDRNAYLDNASFVNEERSKTAFGYPIKIYNKYDSKDKIMFVGAMFFDPFVLNTLTDTGLPNAMGAVYIFEQASGSTTWTYKSAVYSQGYTSANITSNLSTYKNGVNDSRFALFGYDFDYKDGNLAVTEPGGEGAVTSTGKVYLFDVKNTPTLLNTYLASNITLPTVDRSQLLSQSIDKLGDAIGPFDNFGTSVVLRGKNDPITWSDGSRTITMIQNQAIHHGGSTIYNLRNGQVFGFEYETIEGVQKHKPSLLQEEVKLYQDAFPIKDIRETPPANIHYQSKIIGFRKLDFGTSEKIGVVREFLSRPNTDPYFYTASAPHIEVTKLSILDVQREADGTLVIFGPTPLNNNIDLTVRAITDISGAIPLTLGRSRAINSGVMTLNIRHPAERNNISLFIKEWELSGAVPLYTNADKNFESSGVASLYLDTFNAIANVNLSIGKVLGRESLAMPHLTMSGGFYPTVTNRTTLFVGEEYRNKQDMPLYLNNYFEIFDSNATSDYNISTLNIKSLSHTGGVFASGTSLLTRGPSKADTIGSTSLHTITPIPPIVSSGVQTVYRLDDGDFKLFMSGNNVANVFSSENAGTTLLIRNPSTGNNSVPLYINKAVGDTMDLTIKPHGKMGGGHATLFFAKPYIGPASGNVSLYMQSPTTNNLNTFTRGFLE